MIPNPEHKGKWKAPLIENPNYKVSVHPKPDGVLLLLLLRFQSCPALFDVHRCLLMTGSNTHVINTAESMCSSPAKTKQSPCTMH
jgi:hypothetical protein